MKSSSEHWNEIFCTKEDSQLGWYEKSAIQTMELLNKIPAWEKSTIFLAGAGTTVLAEELLGKRANLVINDISNEALEKLKNTLKNANASRITWLCQDISQPIQVTLPEIKIWIDRAVLHFLTNEDDIEGYFKNVKLILKPGSYAIFAEFSKNGAPKCAGLTVHRYSLQELSERLGSSFKLNTSFDYTYINPYGDPRPYIYTLFEKI